MVMSGVMKKVIPRLVMTKEARKVGGAEVVKVAEEAENKFRKTSQNRKCQNLPILSLGKEGKAKQNLLQLLEDPTSTHLQ
jgi:hypothetical protein